MKLFSASVRLGKSSLRPLRLCVIFLFLALTTVAQTIPTPKDVLGWTPGDDRKLASWAQVVDYFKKLDAASDRVTFEEIGKTTMGTPFVYATISTPENLKNLEKYKQINAKLADPRTIKSNDAAAKKLIAEGKTIVLITCGVHSTEVGSYLSSMLIAHKLAIANDPETKNILENTIILLVPSLNPDGVDIVNNWYQKTLGTTYEGTEPPELYHKYAGHDNNRDWYAFTQVETQLTVDKIHNVWHPQIVHDIHQQGINGSRLFLPPYMQPVEPNVPKQLVEGYTELGNAMAADLRKKGFEGITTNSTYDAWTPSRAYSHYHGGVRILSETASAKLATPVTVKFSDLRPGEGYDPRVESPNFGPVWKGGEWHIRDITNYMTTAAFSLMNNAANEREHWLSRFYEIGKEAVRPRKGPETKSVIIDRAYPFMLGLQKVLERAQVEFNKDRNYGEPIEIPLNQPYSAFAVALTMPQLYPDLLDSKGHPIAPYDVTAHSYALLQGVEVRTIKGSEQSPRGKPDPRASQPKGRIVDTNSKCNGDLVFSIYRSEIPSMDEGWTRWTVENTGDFLRDVGPYFRYCKEIKTEVRNSQIFDFEHLKQIHAIVFPDQPPNQILNGYPKGTMPDEYTGGVGKEGVENLKKFVEAGGTLVFLNRASNFAIQQFDLPVKDVTQGLARKDFYIPGSILRTELDTTHPIAKGMPQQSIAWFESGPAFEIVGTQAASLQVGTETQAGSLRSDIRIIATYPKDPKQILLSGWALGAEKIAGKAALVEFTIGKGKIILFGFRPQYRGQSLATFPLLFNSISQ